MRIVKRKIIIITCLIIFVLFGIIYIVFWEPNYTQDGKMRILVIPKKASFNAITESLYVNDVIRNRFLFNLAARLLGKTTILKAGKYGFRNSMSNLDILDDLEKGTSRQVVSVVIP